LSFPILNSALASLREAEKHGELERQANRPVTLKEFDQLDDQTVLP
jgi:hypothetical protein